MSSQFEQLLASLTAAAQGAVAPVQAPAGLSPQQAQQLVALLSQLSQASPAAIAPVAAAPAVAAPVVPAAVPVAGVTSFMQPGNNYLIRTVTHYYTGKVQSISAEEIVLTEACWIADTGRFFNALNTGELSEVEPFPDPVMVGRGAVVDVTPWRHALPAAQN